MKSSTTHIAGRKLKDPHKPVKGYLTELDGEEMYCIENYDVMDPFLMSIVSSSDLWMFISSSGSLTAGRQNPNNALFPYYTDDKIHESSLTTGPKTILRITVDNRMLVWEPFSILYQGLYNISRKLYKNTAGNKIVFEETNEDLNLSFSYSWMSSDQLGWVRESRLTNLSGKSVETEVADGLLNVLPYGITRDMQSTMSTLMDAYKVAEWLPESKLALFRLSSIPFDRAEPNEALRTNCIRVHGPDDPKVLLSSRQINKFRFGYEVETEQNTYGTKTSFIVCHKPFLAPGKTLNWFMIADTARDSSEIISLQNKIKNEKNFTSFIRRKITESSAKLHRLVSMSDGLQQTGDKLNDRRHFANVMFNIMRGGIFEGGYVIHRDDFLRYLEQSNKEVFLKFRDRYEELNTDTGIDTLSDIALATSDKDLLRLSYEYLPLSFSRRHGDPSRPWNHFDIRVKNPDGSPLLSYQGNWRDIFQNWEALAFSFPAYLPGMICRFLNASTADGYNPYRITREGIDWEVPERDNPWSYIGYWGDHQIVYLLKLLELHEKIYPGQILIKLSEPVFVYASVPYRIKKYTDILKDPQNTIMFDRELHSNLIQRSHETGADGKLVLLRNGQILRVTFIEKILVSLLTKLSNFIPGAGIWLNTQRPEWNDANNALAGNGASMVTLYHLQSYIVFFQKVVSSSAIPGFTLSAEVHLFYKNIYSILKEFTPHLHKEFTDHTRKSITDALGAAGSTYREMVYDSFSGDKANLEAPELGNFFSLVQAYLENSIAENKRSDGLYHSYNLPGFSDKTISVQRLPLMLEGQVAILGSGFLNTEETLVIIKSLFESELWREDQQSFMLYPYRNLPGFMEKNLIPEDLVKKSRLLQEIFHLNHTGIIKQDENGNYHFDASLKNTSCLKEALQNLSVYVAPELLAKESEFIFTIYESVFQHRYFTGRSGSFYKYEGIGCIYWHLVSKLLLALGESIMQYSLACNGHEAWLKELIGYYHKIKAGIGTHKNPQHYGAFPTDPYSHTPSMTGVQQPGMTGQVKEDILSRFNELGLRVDKGEIRILPVLLRDEDFDASHELSFTYGNTPFKYKKEKGNMIEVSWKDAPSQLFETDQHIIPSEISDHIFKRSGQIVGIVVYF